MDLYLHIAILLVSLFFIFLFYKRKHPGFDLPPGKKGWPIIGETWDYVMTGRRGVPEKFAKDRMAKFSSEVFQTSLLGENMAVFCGAAGNKFLFSNENKCVKSWWPSAIEKLSPQNSDGEVNVQEGTKQLRNIIKTESLQDYVPVMDSMAKEHIEAFWSPYKEVEVFPLTKKYTFDLACTLFMGVKDPELSKSLYGYLKHIMTGFISFPINFPGTAFNRALKGIKLIRERLISIVNERKKELLMVKNKQRTAVDLLTRMLLESDESEVEIANNIVSLLVAGYDTLSTAITWTINHLAEYPHIYQEVLKEQMEIAKSKCPGELLNWGDIQKMRYSWCVACETMRLLPPVGGTFREAITDITYEGFTVPKGWKTHWTVHSTHKNPTYFPDPEKFDPTRFEGYGPVPFSFVPFGGGPKMCPGKEYARLEILVFMHNLVTKFKLKKANPAEKIIYNPNPIPVNGLLVELERIDA